MNGLLLQNKRPRRVPMRKGNPWYGRRLCDEVRHRDVEFKSCVMPKLERTATRETVRNRMHEIKQEIRAERARRRHLEAEAKAVAKQKLINRDRMRMVRSAAAALPSGFTGGGTGPPLRDGLPHFGRRSCNLTKLYDEEVLRTCKNYIKTGQMASILTGS